MTMNTRRDFFRFAAEGAALAMLPAGVIVAEEKREAAAPVRHGRPLLELQQKFIDMRFGMFVHFNMATFQDREWGDPTSPASQFNPTNLDTDQWAAAAKSANMTWGCLTT